MQRNAELDRLAGRDLRRRAEPPARVKKADYSVFITLAAAATVRAMSASVCVVERKPASNCDGAK